MKITGTENFEDFCKQNNFTRKEGIQALEKKYNEHLIEELEAIEKNHKDLINLRILERKVNLLDYKDYNDFKQRTGLSGIAAVEFLLNEIKKLKEKQDVK